MFSSSPSHHIRMVPLPVWMMTPNHLKRKSSQIFQLVKLFTNHAKRVMTNKWFWCSCRLQAYMQESLDPICRTSKKADIMWKGIFDSYNKMIVVFNQSNMDCLTLDHPFTPLPLCTWPSLKNHWSKSIQLAANKFSGIHFCYPMNSNETDETHFKSLFKLYENEIGDREIKTIPREFGYYFQAYLWLQMQPKFGSHFVDPNEKRTERRIVQGNKDNDDFAMGDHDPDHDTFPG